jgi:hypothetical protein
MNLTKIFSTHRILPALACAIVLPLTAFAHHGQDFLLLEDYHLPAPGGGHLMGNFEWEKHSDGDEFGIGPSLMFGVLPHVALSVDVDFRDEGDGFDYNSVMPAAHFQLTPPDWKSPVKVALSVGYQWTDAAGGEESGHDDEHGEQDGHEEEEGGHHRDGEAGSGHSHADLIHNHDSDALVSRLIIEGDFGKTKAVLNVISVVRDGGEAAWGYAAGVRHAVMGRLALGVEALGDFESDGWHELVAGAYVEPVESLTLKIGAGFGLTEATPDFTLRTGFIWRF